MAPEITVDRLAWDMAQLEIHIARNALQAALVKAQMIAKRHPKDQRAHELIDVLQELRHRVDQALLKALRDHAAELHEAEAHNS